MLEETATRRDGRDPGTVALCQGGSLCSRRGSGTKSQRIGDGSGGGGRPPAVRSTPRGPPGQVQAHTRLLSPFSFAQPPHRPALLTAGTCGYPDRGQHRRLAWCRTPEGSRGHAAVTQPGSVKKPEEPRCAGEDDTAAIAAPFARGAEDNTSHATGSELERRPPCLNTGHCRDSLLRGAQKSRPAEGPLRRHLKGLIDQ